MKLVPMPGHTTENPDLGEVHVAKHNLGPNATLEELQTEETRLLAEYANSEYQRQRATAYPSIGDQLDAIWKGGEAEADMLATVQAVKAKYPKA